MINLSWRKRIAVWRNRLHLYPAPEPLPPTPLFWLATGLVAFLALLFAGYFIFYLVARQNTFITSAEDLGIMDQAIWNTVHGHILHQTICNAISDTNCQNFNGISRFAIHFEPILFPVALFYLLWSDPKMLLVLQTVIVASGAFPAFWLARLRLRNELAAVVMALVYLLYPSLQQATIYDFHAVTFTAAFLLFTLYFMYTRRTVWLFVFAILAMACKEEIPAIIIFFGLWSMLFQQRVRSGFTLVLLATCWIGLEFFIFHLFSPTGHPLLASRYANLGSNPLDMARNLLLHPLGILHSYVLDPAHLLYLRILLAPTAYLPILAPWVFVLALPSVALNLLSSDPNMYSGNFQYNAEIVPALIFSTIEAIVLLVWLAQRVLARVQMQQRMVATRDKPAFARPRLPLWVHLGLIWFLLGFVVYSSLRIDQVRGAMPFSVVSDNLFHGATPFSSTFQWPQTTAHDALAQHFIDLIPSSASVSAQSHLVPHISQRPSIYQFPYADERAEYIFLDVISNTYPLFSYNYITEVKKVLLSGDYGVVAAQDGYLLLKRGLHPPGISPYSLSQASSNLDAALPNLPASFCSFVYVSPAQVQNPLQVTFTSPDGSSSLDLVGESVEAPEVFHANTDSMQFATYWKVNAPISASARFLTLVTDQAGKEHFLSTDFPASTWCPTNSWKPGNIIAVESDELLLSGYPHGLAHISLALLPASHPFNTIMNGQDWFPLHIEQAARTIVPDRVTNSLQLATITIVP